MSRRALTRTGQDRDLSKESRQFPMRMPGDLDQVIADLQDELQHHADLSSPPAASRVVKALIRLAKPLTIEAETDAQERRRQKQLDALIDAMRE